jgi:gliding motility-associated-like protein
MSDKDKIEKIFKEALEGHEMPYNPEAWSAVSRALPKSQAPLSSWFFAAASLAGVGLFAYFMWFNVESTRDTITEQTPETNQSIAALISENSNNETEAQEETISETVIAQEKNANDPIDELTKPFTSKIEDFGIISSTDATELYSNDLTDVHHIQPVLPLYNCVIDLVVGLNRIYCEHSEVHLAINRELWKESATWILSNGKVFDGTEVRFKAEKDLKIRLRLTHSNSRTELTDWYSLKVESGHLPEINITETERNTKKLFVFENQNPSIEHLVWRIDNKVCKGQTCDVYLTKQGTIEYQVESYDNRGCYSSITETVEVAEDYNLYVETAFTPNGDGLNDIFMPIALTMRNVSFKLQIFDRNGKLVFESTEASNSWDGTISGSQAPEDIYIWSVSLINEEGYPEQYRGHLTLIR